VKHDGWKRVPAFKVHSGDVIGHVHYNSGVGLPGIFYCRTQVYDVLEEGKQLRLLLECDAELVVKRELVIPKRVEP
jgi:hypothetical protein